jgi:Protein of unknown function (DUF1549)/Protein of unknown function (DUF1553)
LTEETIVLRWLALAAVLLMPASARADELDPRDLARRIDALLTKHHKANKVHIAPQAEDAEFLRRAYLDLTGRIPKVGEVRAFLADKDVDKRYKIIVDLLDSPRHAKHFATTWRALLAPEITAGGESAVFQLGFETWLYQKFRTRTGYDQLVFDLLATPIASDPANAEFVFRDFDKPNALAFFAVKDAKPENLAAVSTRLFLGVQLECAQCHDHPFAQWSRKQFWNQAAFFAGIERQGKGIFQPLTEDANLRVLTLPDSTKKSAAMFLDGKEPNFKPGVSSRVTLAKWITAPENAYFAKAAVNRLWGHLFGMGIIDPVDNSHDENPPSHPELLDELAKAFAASKFDLNYLITALCLTEAYQRTSTRTHVSQDDPRVFGRMGVKALTGEQFFDSLALATAFREQQPAAKAGKGGKGAKGGAAPRAQFLALFAQRGPTSEPETSVQQALTLMNGKFLTDATSLRSSPMLTAVMETPMLDTKQRVEILYLATLSRPPSARELKIAVNHVASTESAREHERLGDVFWALLNSAEFRLNH